MAMIKNIRVGKVLFNACTQQEFVDEIGSRPRGAATQYVCFAGGPAVINAQADDAYLKVLNEADYCMMDGAPVAKEARRLGIPSERCGGPDVMGLILADGTKRGKRNFFYGSTEETLKLLKQSLEKRYPGISICGMYSPPFRQLTPEEEVEVVETINSTRPDYVWVGLGSPKQDIWMSGMRDRLDGTVMFGVGAAFNFLAGTVKRAPAWMQRLGFEWLYRLVREPKWLWKRYILGGPKLMRILLSERSQLISVN